MKTACRHCGRTFSAPESWLNTTVQCPHCQGSVLVHPVAVAEAMMPYSEAADPADDEDDDEFRLAPETERPQSGLYSDVLASAKTQDAPKPASRTRGASKPGGNTPEAPSSAAQARSRPASSPKKFDPDEEPEHACPNCAAPLPPDAKLCVECGYHMRLRRVIDIEHAEDDFDDSTGVQRWLNRNLADGESFGTLLLALHGVAAVAGIFIAGLLHPWGWIGLVAVIILYAVWVQSIRRRGGIDYLGEKCWRWHLRLRRAIGWRSFLPMFRPLRQFVSHSKSFDDQQLLALANVEDLEVLDLEGTSVSYTGLRRLSGCQRLRYIVLYRTKVTAEAARRLQGSLPDANLWHD